MKSVLKSKVLKKNILYNSTNYNCSYLLYSSFCHILPILHATIDKIREGGHNNVTSTIHCHMLSYIRIICFLRSLRHHIDKPKEIVHARIYDNLDVKFERSAKGIWTHWYNFQEYLVGMNKKLLWIILPVGTDCRCYQKQRWRPCFGMIRVVN